MKKIIPLALVMLMLVAMAVPAFAFEYSYSGHILPEYTSLLDEHPNAPYVVISLQNNSYSLKLTTAPAVHDDEGSLYRYQSSGTIYQFNLVNGTWVYDGAFSDKGLNGYGDYYIIWANYDIVYKSGGVWYSTSSPSLPICDGTSCPATDLNADGVCDDCGMTLRLLVNGYPSLPVVDGNNQHSVYTEDEGGRTYYVFYSNASYTPTGTVGDQLTAKFDSNVNYKIFRCTDGKNWVETVSSSGYQYGLGYTDDVVIVGSTFDFYDESGNLFFPLPLWVTVEQVTQGEMMGVTNQLNQTMLILALCGVGCLALLIGLVLFGKVLRPYLG